MKSFFFLNNKFFFFSYRTNLTTAKKNRSNVYRDRQAIGLEITLRRTKKVMYTILLLFRKIERKREKGEREKEKKFFFYSFDDYWLISNIREQRLVGEHVTVYYGY